MWALLWVGHLAALMAACLAVSRAVPWDSQRAGLLGFQWAAMRAVSRVDHSAASMV